MKSLLLLLNMLFAITTAQTQPSVQGHLPLPSNTYAIVIGISDYKDPDIPKLSFSNRDAMVFADFLMSAPGGSVPKQNIKLLTDSSATIGEVDKAIRWVMNNCRQDDKVFFYFSGHGEMENVTMSKNGYLICYNTPVVAFVNMGLSIDYLNDIVNTLSVQTRAKVIVITDACHSGTMTGNKFKGNFFVGEQLMLKKENEIRMASCKPDELSNEKTDWGGGRGVFSYYLVNALQGGLADRNKDDVVSVGELKSYMESSMAADIVLKKEGNVQTPVIKGSDDFQLSKVIETEAAKIKEQVSSDSVMQVMAMSSAPDAGAEEITDPAEYFLSLLKQKSLEALTDSAKLNVLPDAEIAFALIAELGKGPLQQKEKDRLAELAIELKKDKERSDRFNLDVAGSFLDVGQNVIANYISGDEAELERRRYYNSKNNGYDVYTRMFAVALKLSQADKYYRTKAEVFLHYFTGLSLRLKIPLTENPKPLIEQALAEQKKALALEEYAAYIYNELGVLYQYKKNYSEAEKFFIKATELSPQWAIPQSNLSGLYITQRHYDKAINHANIADTLQANLQTISINRGLINERKGNQLFAEEDYRHAIDINSRHFLPFERLGYVYMNTANYAQADSFFYEADLRKKGYHFKGNTVADIEANVPMLPVAGTLCNIDSASLSPDDVLAFFTWGVQEYKLKRYANAIRILRKVVAIDVPNPLVYHYLGKAYYDQQKWEEAELMFSLACRYSKDRWRLTEYTDSVARSKTYRYDRSCFEKFFREHFYHQVEDYYFLATLSENWKHLEEAEKYLRQIISFDTIYYQQLDSKGSPIVIWRPNAIDFDTYQKNAAYVKLWHLLEKQGRFDETEATIASYAKMDGEQSVKELNEFYRRMIERFPDDGSWSYRLGNLLYQYAQVCYHYKYMDTILWLPLLHKEIFVDTAVYLSFDSDVSLTLYDISETGQAGNERILINPGLARPDRITYGVPGTGEFIPGAGKIFTPRMDAIRYLQQAATLVSVKESLADIHFKTGNLYLWAGSKKQAYPFFEKSLSLVPDNANARLTLIDIYKALYKNRAAFKQLNYLNDNNQVNLSRSLLLAQFNILAGNFGKADESLNKTESYVPYQVGEIYNLRGLSAMLNNKPKLAIEMYKNFQALKKSNEPDIACFSYSIARLYAKTGNANEAWKYLQIAIGQGFNFGYILENDNYIADLRKSPKWQTTISSIAAKKYKSDKPVD